jgi:hypothetical protein
MPRTNSARVEKIVSGLHLEVRFGAELVNFAGSARRSESATQVAKKSSWIASFVGLFDESPLSTQILENERRAREIMDAQFVMPE